MLFVIFFIVDLFAGFDLLSVFFAATDFFSFGSVVFASDQSSSNFICSRTFS
jgi:hypothetical protein